MRVLTEGMARGMTVMDTGSKKWNSPNGWTGRPSVHVAVAVQGNQLLPCCYSGCVRDLSDYVLYNQVSVRCPCIAPGCLAPQTLKHKP